jgi:hypothetical protein
VDGTVGLVSSTAVNGLVPGNYVLTYNYTDGASNAAAEVTVAVMVVDTTAPVITLIGSDMLILSLGESFVDPGATASDSVDGDLTSSIVAGGQSVDTNSPGSYTLTYTVSDLRGNTTQRQRTVIVVEVVAPALELECLRNPTEDTRISFQTAYGLDYTLQTSTDLIQWDPLDTISGDGFGFQFIHTGGGAGPKRFYKVTVTKSHP